MEPNPDAMEEEMRELELLLDEHQINGEPEREGARPEGNPDELRLLREEVIALRALVHQQRAAQPMNPPLPAVQMQPPPGLQLAGINQPPPQPINQHAPAHQPVAALPVHQQPNQMVAPAPPPGFHPRPMDPRNADAQNHINPQPRNGIGRHQQHGYPCRFCQQDHRSWSCSNFPTIRMRQHQLMRLGRCTKCTKRRHAEAFCRSRVAWCHRCSLRHPLSLCPAFTAE